VAAPAGGGKFGVYAEDRAAYEWVRAGVPDGRRCLEAQVMDWADDVAYSVHDLEDGVHAGLIRIGMFDAAARADLVEVAARLYTDHDPAELAGVLDALLELPSLRDLAGYDRSFESLAAAKRVTSELTGRFVGAAVCRHPLGAQRGPTRALCRGSGGAGAGGGGVCAC
jgi:dGTPase